MVVVNLTGFNYPVSLGFGRQYVIPFFNPPKPVFVPDEAYGKFGNGIRVITPPKPVVKFDNKSIVKEEVVKPTSDERKEIINKTIDVKIENTKPLKGVKIKKKRRKELLNKEKEDINGIV